MWVDRRRGVGMILLDGPEHAAEVLKIVFSLRRARVSAAFICDPGRSLRSMMREADRSNFLDVIVLGEQEFRDKKFKVKDMEDGSVEEFDLEKIVDVLIERNSYEIG